MTERFLHVFLYNVCTMYTVQYVNVPLSIFECISVIPKKLNFFLEKCGHCCVVLGSRSLL